MGIKNSEIIVRCCVVDPTKQINKQAKTYIEKITPTLMPISDYFENVQSKKEWIKHIAENIAVNVYGVQGTVTIE